MPQAKGKPEKRKPDGGKGVRVPPERWSVEPPFDSADYLEGDPPGYADSDDTAAAGAAEEDGDGSRARD